MYDIDSGDTEPWEPLNDQHRRRNMASEQLLLVGRPKEPPAVWVLLLIVSAAL